MNTPVRLQSTGVQRTGAPDYIVIDGFMRPSELEALHDYVKREPFFYENAFEWNKVWHPVEGRALLTGPKARGAPERPGLHYPTDTPYDLFFETMDRQAAAIADVVGCTEDAIKYVVAAYLYRSGWALPWHDDAGDYQGAFAFYIHAEWKANWGGELMILTEPRLSAPCEGAIDLGFTQGAGFPQPAFAQHGKGEFVMPKPNRIVFMRRGLIHAINRVSPLAGENMRFSLSGFFL